MADRQVNPFAGKKLQAEAYELGLAAHGAGADLDDWPMQYQKPLARAWKQGWMDAAAQARPAQIVARVPAVETRALHPLAVWPEDKPLPSKYHRPPVPCPTCKRLLTDDGGRAAVVKYIDGSVAAFRCRATPGCPDWKLPVER